MDAFVSKIRDIYTASNTKEFIISGAGDVQKLPTSDSYGTFGQMTLDEKCAIGSFAYTSDLSFICMLGTDNQWHEV